MNADLGVHPGRTPGSDLSSQFLDSARRPWLDHRASWIGKHFGALCQMISSYTRLYPRYARISTIDQNADMQLTALQRAGVDRKNIFKDELSGATTNRPALLRCLKKLKDGATIIVWKLDRLARSLRDLIAMVEDFNRRGVNFR